MNSKYLYNDKNLETVIKDKTEKVTAMIAEEENIDFDTALQRFLASDTYAALSSVNTRMWGENAAFLFDDYLRSVKQANLQRGLEPC